MAVETSDIASSLPYHEPDIITILTQASFLLLLNIVNAGLDRLLYCGLLGQVLIGIAWGTPGAKWLSVNVEETVVQLGYLGLILLVYEGVHLLFSQQTSHLEKASDDVRLVPNGSSSPWIGKSKYTLLEEQELILRRWSIHLFPVVKSQSATVIWCRSDWHRRTHWSLLYSPRTSRCYSRSSICGRSCAMFD